MTNDARGTDRFDTERMRDEARHLTERASDSPGRWALVGLGAGMIGLGAWMVMQGMRQGDDGDGDMDMFRGGVRDAGRSVRVRERVTIAKAPDELYDFWRDLENLPKVMRHLKSVERDPNTGLTHWVADAPLGLNVSWDAETTDEVPGELISWRSTPDSQVETEGTVQFRRVGTGRTDLIVSMAYRPPGGRAGDAIAQWFGRDGQQEVQEDLQRFKEEVEAGRLALR